MQFNNPSKKIFFRSFVSLALNHVHATILHQLPRLTFANSTSFFLLSTQRLGEHSSPARFIIFHIQWMQIDGIIFPCVAALFRSKVLGFTASFFLLLIICSQFIVRILL